MSQINTRIRQKRDTAANWTNNNPVLLNGELIVVETSTGAIRLKVGDGVKTFNQLPFLDETLRALITDVDNNNSAVVMTKNGESQLLDTFNIVKLSEEEYNQLIDSNTLDPDTLYFTVGEGDEKYSKVILKDLINNAQDEVLEILNIIRLSQEEYNSLAAAGTLDPKAIYMTEADNGGNIDELKTYIDNADATTLNSAKTYSDNANATTLNSAKTYSDNANATTLNSAKAYSDNANATTLNSAKTYSNNNFLKLSGGTVTGVTTFSNTTASTSTTTGAVKISGGLGVAKNIYANKVYGAVWNDYAECRESNDFIDAGYVVKENGDDTLSLADGRLIYGCSIVSDTFGFMIGETDKAHTPIAVSGRVLAYPYENREVFRYNIGCFVCSGPNGTVSLMNKEEVWNHPEAIIGQVSAVPDYEYWGNNVKVNGRVWIKVR